MTLFMLLQVSQTVLVSTMQDQLANLVHIILKHQREDPSYKVSTCKIETANAMASYMRAVDALYGKCNPRGTEKQPFGIESGRHVFTFERENVSQPRALCRVWVMTQPRALCCR